MPRPRKQGPARRHHAAVHALGVNEIQALLTGRPYFPDLSDDDIEQLRDEHGEWVDAVVADCGDAHPFQAVVAEAKRRGVWAE